MNGAAAGARPRNVTIEDEPEPGDPPPRPQSPSLSPPPLPSSRQRSPQPPSPQAPSSEIIDVDTPASDEPEYMTPLGYQNSLICEATMPALPSDMNDFGIPPSPPGSPDPSLAAKLEKFRQLRDKGVFFNDRLGGNRGFRNPKLLERLRGYVGVDDEYGSHLSTSVWDPHGFTEDQYFDVLADKQKKEFDALQARQANEQRSTIEFTSSAREARERSAADRIMEGLNSKPNSRPGSRTGGDGDRKRGRYDDRQDDRGYWRGDRRDDRRDGHRSRERSRERERDRDRDRGRSYRDDRGRR